MATMYETFCKLSNPKVVKRSSHKLTDIQILSVLVVICGANNYDAIELFGKARHEELKEILQLSNGISSHDTINHMFQLIDARGFERPATEDLDVDKGHGRIEVRHCQAFEPDVIIRMDHKWKEGATASSRSRRCASSAARKPLRSITTSAVSPSTARSVLIP